MNIYDPSIFIDDDENNDDIRESCYRGFLLGHENTVSKIIQFKDGAVIPENGEHIVKLNETNAASAKCSVKALRNLVQGHITFYMEAQVNSATGELTDFQQPLIRTVNQGGTEVYEFDTVDGVLPFDIVQHRGTEIPVTIYWSWTYDYPSLPEILKNNIRLSSGAADDLVRYDRFFDLVGISLEDLAAMPSGTAAYQEQVGQLYDYGDTKIGAYVKNMQMHLKVDGYQHYGSGSGSGSGSGG